MVKRAFLFGLVFCASLFVLIACPKKVTVKTKIEKFEVMRDFVSLKNAGYVPPVIKLGNSYVNDRIESKEKTLSYEYSYKRLNDGENFPTDDASIDKVFNDGNIFYTSTINEREAGNSSKINIKYEKLKIANGGEICIGTRFILGLKVKDQIGDEVYRAKILFTVVAPKAGAVARTGNVIAVPGNQTSFFGTVTTVGGGEIDEKETKFSGDYTIYKLTGDVINKSIALKYADFGETNKVLIK